MAARFALRDAGERNRGGTRFDRRSRTADDRQRAAYGYPRAGTPLRERRAESGRAGGASQNETPADVGDGEKATAAQNAKSGLQARHAAAHQRGDGDGRKRQPANRAADSSPVYRWGSRG